MRNDIIELRKRIDLVDNKLLILIKTRLNIVTEIANIKKDFNLPISDPEREKEIIDRLINETEQIHYRKHIEAFFKEIFRISKEWQEWIVLD
jgi:chorismate mutase/prephenate dehydratase